MPDCGFDPVFESSSLEIYGAAPLPVGYAVEDLLVLDLEEMSFIVFEQADLSLLEISASFKATIKSKEGLSLTASIAVSYASDGPWFEDMQGLQV